jgi:GNAT superfamily N-acetyltransferase
MNTTKISCTDKLEDRLLAQVEAVLEAVYPGKGYPAFFRADIASAPAIVFAAHEGNLLAGFAVLFPSHLSSHTAELGWATVLPACQGKGIGSRLLDERLKWATAHGFKTVIVETRPTRLYLDHGFLPTAPITSAKQILIWKQASPAKHN